MQTARSATTPRRLTGSAAAAAVCLLIVLVAASRASAADLTVTVGGDGGDGVCDSSCTLRDAVSAANALSSDDTIHFSESVRGTIVLTEGELPITQPLTVVGPGASSLTISADADHSGDQSDADSRAFGIDTAAGAAVSLAELTIAAGSSAGSGGALSVEGASLTLTGLAVVDSHADGDGGALYIGETTAGLSVVGSTIAGSQADGDGGGIAVGGPATGSISISNSTISGNSAGGDGGGIHARNASSRPIAITNSTIASNVAAGAGGGIYRSAVPFPGSGTIALSSSVVGDNTASAGADIADGAAASGSFRAGFSLLEDASAANLLADPAGTNRIGVDPRLRPLELNEGTTMTQRPTSTSPTLDAGIANGLSEDQRGFNRTTGIRHVDNARGSDATDIGAVELRFPKARIDSGPRDTISRRNAKIRFSSNTPGSTFMCSFDFAGFEPCESPFRAKRLREGYHQLQVRAGSGDGINGRVARRDFVVDTRLIRAKAKAKRVQRQRGGRVKVKVDAGAGEDVTIAASGRIDVRGLGRFPLKKSKVAIPGQRVKQFTLRPKSERAVRKIMAAVRKRKKVVARVDITIVDRGSHRFHERIKVKLKR